MNTDFFRIAAVSPAVNVADCDFNAEKIIDVCHRLHKKGVQLAVFPEMSVTAYSCADLFHSSTLLVAAERALMKIAQMSLSAPGMIIIVGAPLRTSAGVANCGVVIANGEILLAVPKSYVPNYNEFYECRWWTNDDNIESTISIQGKSVPISANQLIKAGDVKIGIEICEDLWAPLPPSTNMAMVGAQIIVNLSASNDLIGKYEYLTSLIRQQSSRCLSAYVYASAGYGESTTDLVFDGKTIIAENGKILAANNRFNMDENVVIADVDIDNINHDRRRNTTFRQCATRWMPIMTELPVNVNPHDGELLRTVDPHPFVPSDSSRLDERCREIISLQSLGLCRRLQAAHSNKAVVGISGGLDSTLALIVAADAFDRLNRDRSDIIGVTMPGFGTTDRTYNNALVLMKSLGITMREISVVSAVKQHFSDIGHNPDVHDVTYENAQARYRTMLLMDIANKENGIVIGTGDLSELALGWATYNGDHMSMYGVNAGVPKTLVRHLVGWYASQTDNADTAAALRDVLDTPISPELLPADSEGNIAQLTEDLVGPYELHDFFLYHFVRYGESPKKIFRLACIAFEGVYSADTIRQWLRKFFSRFFSQQFKRSCLPDGPKVGSVCLSPRGDWRMPSDATAALWLAEIDTL